MHLVTGVMSNVLLMQDRGSVSGTSPGPVTLRSRLTPSNAAAVALNPGRKSRLMQAGRILKCKFLQAAIAIEFSVRCVYDVSRSFARTCGASSPLVAHCAGGVIGFRTLAKFTVQPGTQKYPTGQAKLSRR